MSREIKFRAWDNHNKKWLLGYEYPNLGGFSLFGGCVLMGEWENVATSFLFGKNGLAPEDLKIMQYTGLKDKNGKEIYEGDIYRYNSSATNYQVMFVGGAFCGGISEDSCAPIGWRGSDDREDGDLYEDYYYKKHLEVIGNIYENPELLKP
jgi:uncharacterized phage protein (TIGR01671 family)